MGKGKNKIDPDLANKSFQLDSLSPSGLRWKIGFGHEFSGEIAGCLVDRGYKKYWQVRWNNKLYYAHRIVWAIQNNLDPFEIIVNP
jgi:hypothetical protein